MTMAKKNKDLREKVTITKDDVGSLTDILGTPDTSDNWPKVPDLQCHSCHDVFDTIRFYHKAPDVPLCERCYRIVERQDTRAIQTPTNPERV